MKILFNNKRSKHDCSFLFLKDNKINYLKLERYLQIKHFGKNDEADENKFNTICDSVLFSLGFNEKDLFLAKKHSRLGRMMTNNIHHRLHALSIDFMEKIRPNIHIVIDGNGDFYWYSVIRDNELIDSGKITDTGGSLGNGLAFCSYDVDVDGHTLDTPGKIMGLQSYGKFDEEHYAKIEKYNMKYIGKQDCVHFSSGRFIKRQDHLFCIPKNISYQKKIDILHTIHKKAGEIVLSIFEKYVRSDERVGYSGGVAQNVVWNTNIKKKFPNLIIYPHSNDEGIPIGWIETFRLNNNLSKDIFKLNNYPYCQFDQAPDTQPSIDTIHKVAKFLAEGKIVAWYQGHGEIGPRALGNRSILMDPRIPNGKDIINRVKKREWYRPFGCSVLSEYAKEYFDLDYPNPYMLYLGHAQKNDLPAITHVDGTSRAQTVDINSGHFRTLIEHFFELTGCPVLLNTSLNEAGKPIAGWIKNAENLFAMTHIDVLVIGDEIRLK